MLKKKEGFPGQLSYVIPDKILEKLKKHPFIEDLFFTDIGYYPRAYHHFRSRSTGSQQAILIYNIEGQGYITIGNTQYTLPPDHFFIIPPYVPHSYHAEENDPWSIYWIHLKGKKLNAYIKSSSQIIPIERSRMSRISERIELFNEIFRNLERGFSIENLEYVYLCLPHLLASFTHIKQFRSINDPLNNDPISLAINFMLENLEHKLTLAQVAKEVKLSVTYFSRLFLERTGFSPIEYFIQLKIQHSCRLLENRSLSVADVARTIGYEDQFYFSRQFRKIMEMSPMDYRKKRIQADI